MHGPYENPLHTVFQYTTIFNLCLLVGAFERYDGLISRENNVMVNQTYDSQGSLSRNFSLEPLAESLCLCYY
jgi:hypothetical protein